MVEAVNYVLPTKKTGKDTGWTDQKFLMIGPPKIGKSKFWSFGERTLYVQTEAGLGHVDVMKLAANSWGELGQIYTALIQHQGEFPYDTIVVDTLDNLIRFADQEIIGRIKTKFPKKADDIYTLFDYPGAGDFGNPAWNMRGDIIKNLLDKFSMLPCALCLVGHVDMKKIEGIDTSTISTGGVLGKDILSWADHIMNIKATGRAGEQERVVRSRPAATCHAGSRGEMIPENWTWGKDLGAEYTKFRGLFT